MTGSIRISPPPIWARVVLAVGSLLLTISLLYALHYGQFVMQLCLTVMLLGGSARSYRALQHKTELRRAFAAIITVHLSLVGIYFFKYSSEAYRIVELIDSFFVSFSLLWMMRKAEKMATRGNGNEATEGK